jgi:dihydrofolate reductase
MRKVALQMYLSLDGVMEAPEKWTFQYWDDEHEKYAYDRLLASDALLLGRSTYETFAASWPQRSGDDFTDRMNSYPKYVISETLEHPEWHNSHVVKGNVVAEVSRLKQQPGKDIMVYGSGQLVNTLLQNGLIDDCRIWCSRSSWGEESVSSGKTMNTASWNSSTRRRSAQVSSFSAINRQQRAPRAPATTTSGEPRRRA